MTTPAEATSCRPPNGRIAEGAPASPADVIARWPAEAPLAAARLEPAGTWIVAQPRTTIALASHPVGLSLSVHESGPAAGGAGPPANQTRCENPVDAFARVDEIVRGSSPGVWIGTVSYDIAGVLEPRAVSRHPVDAAVLQLHHCADGYRLDASEVRQRSRPHSPIAFGAPPPLGEMGAESAFQLRFRSAWGREGYTQAVMEALRLIRAGDVYEVNLAHHLVTERRGAGRRAIAAALLDRASPDCGLFIDDPAADTAIASASPETFLRFDPASRTLTAEPMKGTRRAARGAADALRSSAKERAELAMITDLMRNDLGRVCDLGSVRVRESQRIEPHAAGGLLQATSCVEGRLGDDLSLLNALPILLPAGSITGAPKVRAMQVIDELEPTARGHWCGCGVVLDRLTNAGDSMSVLIRTALIERDRVVYPVGAGIVADSVPDLEWQETLAKASILDAIGAVADR